MLLMKAGARTDRTTLLLYVMISATPARISLRAFCLVMMNQTRSHIGVCSIQPQFRKSGYRAGIPGCSGNRLGCVVITGG